FDDIPLRDAHVLEQTPRREGLSGGPGAPERGRPTADRVAQRDMGVTAPQQLEQVVAEGAVRIGTPRLAFDGHAGLLAGGIPGPAPGVSWYGLRRSQSQQRSLVLEQPAFAIQAAAEAGELAARPDHAVAGDNDGDGGLTRGGAHRARA